LKARRKNCGCVDSNVREAEIWCWLVMYLYRGHCCKARACDLQWLCHDSCGLAIVMSFSSRCRYSFTTRLVRRATNTVTHLSGLLCVHDMYEEREARRLSRYRRCGPVASCLWHHMWRSLAEQNVAQGEEHPCRTIHCRPQDLGGKEPELSRNLQVRWAKEGIVQTVGTSKTYPW
jgi:hypothetical protein